MKRRLFLLSSFLLLASCGENKPSLETYSCSLAPVFGSGIQVTYQSSQGDLGDELKGIASKLDALVNPYSLPAKVSASLYTINHTHEPVKVDPMLQDILKKALELEEKTEGYFSPWLGEITTLWKTTLFGGIIADNAYEPSQEDIDLAQSKVGAMLEKIPSSSLVFDEENDTITRRGEAELDLGGLAKGFCVEKMKECLKEHGVTSYLINGGTSSLGLGVRPDGGSFNVVLSYTKNEREIVYKIKNADTSCSAVYEQFKKVGGTLYSHVINPKNGLPVTPFSMAFLRGEDSALLDAFSTSCMLAGTEKTQEWEKKYDFSAALFENKEESGKPYASLVYENGLLERSV